MHELAEQLLSHLKAIWRYRWYAVIFAWILALAGWMTIYRMPDRYESSARVYVDTYSVLRPLLSGLVVQPNLDQLASMVSRTLISRPNLEKLIHMADMDIGLTNAGRERLITRLTKELAITSGGRENIYSITYADTNAQQAKRVVQSLLTMFVEQSRGDQREDAAAARRFIDEQVKIYYEKMVAAENVLTEFRRLHLGLMTGDRRDYYTRMVEAQAALSRARLELKEAENGRDAIKNQLAGHSEPPSLLNDSSADEGLNPEIDARIQGLEQKVDSLRLNYTEQHPDIIAIERMIAQLREQKKAQVKLRRPASGAAKAQDPVHQQLSITLASAEANVAAMKARVAEYGKRYDELKTVANAVPQIDVEYAQITRDYEVAKKNYESLQSRRESAQISGEMESRESVTDFRVIEPARLPLLPSGPNRRRLATMVFILALGGGLGGAFLISQIRPTFNDERRLREASGLPVLGTVVTAWTAAQKARRTRGLVALLISFASLFSAYAAIMMGLVLIVSRA